MRILLLTLPRSRSNWAVSTLSKFHNVTNLNEPYRSLFSLPHVDENYRAISNSLSSIKDCVMKIEITQLTDRYNKNKLLNLDLLDLHSFDKIYTTARLNIADMVCSHRVALESKQWVFTNENPSPKIENIHFNPNDMKSERSMRGCLTDIAVMDYIQVFLAARNISYIPLYYETMIEYAKENWADIKQTQYSASEYDYSKIFTNYEQIPEFIEHSRSKLLNAFAV